jgi:hypothetical protein
MAAQPSTGFDLPSGGALNAIHEMPASDDSSSGPEAIEDEQTQEKLEVPLRLYPREADTEESSAETTEECEVAARADLEASIRKEPRAHSPDMEVEQEVIVEGSANGSAQDDDGKKTSLDRRTICPAEIFFLHILLLQLES